MIQYNGHGCDPAKAYESVISELGTCWVGPNSATFTSFGCAACGDDTVCNPATRKCEAACTQAPGHKCCGPESCGVAAVVDCVNQFDSYCSDERWDKQCGDEAKEVCSAPC